MNVHQTHKKRGSADSALIGLVTGLKKSPDNSGGGDLAKSPAGDLVNSGGPFRGGGFFNVPPPPSELSSSKKKDQKSQLQQKKGLEKVWNDALEWFKSPRQNPSKQTPKVVSHLLELPKNALEELERAGFRANDLSYLQQSGHAVVVLAALSFMTGQIYHLFPISSSLFPATSPETETVDYLQGAFGSGPSPQLNFRRLSPCGSDRLDSASGRGENSQPRNSISLPMPIAQNGCKDKRTHETRTREGFSSPEGSSPRNVRVDSPVTSDPAFADLIELPLRDEALGDRVSGPDEHVLFSNGDVLFDDEQSSFLFGGDRDFDDGEEELLSEEESPKGVEEKRSKEREKEEDQYLDAEQEQKKMKLRRKEKEGESKERIEQKVMFLEPKASRSLFRSKKHEEKPEGNLKQTRQDNEKLKLFQSDGSLALMNKDLEKDIQEKRHTFSLSENLAMRKIDETEEKREEKEEKGHPKRFRKLPNRGNPNEDELLADGDLLSGKWFCRFRASLPLALRNKDSSSDLYDSKHKIGSGGFATVYVARRKRRRFAIKILPHQARRQKCQNYIEALLLSHFSQPNIVHLYSTYIVAGEMWMIMEYLKGGTLTETVKRTTFTEEEICYVAYCLLSALDYLHGLLFVHRDLKSSNIMFSVKGSVKLIDFGLAADFSQCPGHKETILLGSPFWIPPEMIQRRPHSFSADIWSMGICLLELANGSPPHRKNGLRALIVTGTMGIVMPFVSPSKWTPDFHHFISRCLSFDEEKRGTSEELLKHPFLKRRVNREHMASIVSDAWLTQAFSLLL